MQKNRFLLFICMAFLAVACEKSPYPGYSKVTQNMYYQLSEPSIVEPTNEGRALLIEVKIFDEEDSLIFDSKRLVQKHILTREAEINSPFYKFHQKLATGDRVLLQSDFSTLQNWLNLEGVPFFNNEDDKISAQFLVKKKLSSADYEREQYNLEKISKDPDLKEQNDLQKFLNAVFDNPQKHYFNGIYFFLEKEGNGNYPQKGDKIDIAYKGYFLNGELFDHSNNNPQHLSINFGRESQLLAGLEVAIGLLDFGAKAKVILPSGMAFGERGSYDGTVKPYTSLLYEIELIK
jgi:FKBP-type peptidyl-prolyl cis-trans isomerase